MANISDIAKQVYGSPKVTKVYIRMKEIFPSEQAILNLLNGKIQKMRMLDVGMGAGRTTRFFAKKTKTYLGIDFSPIMVETCKRQFSNFEFKVADARSLPQFETGEFDFVLFSFNGIDCLNLEDRKAVLNEMRRVTSKDGFFCFSAHNINSINRQLKFNFRKVFGLWDMNRFDIVSSMLKIKKH